MIRLCSFSQSNPKKIEWVDSFDTARVSFSKCSSITSSIVMNLDIYLLLFGVPSVLYTGTAIGRL